uniref:DNA replication checkpoint mediator MRC1 domain-containing protein n=1 Tax=Pseudo-nitzschia australis TaxID=44445 RepID=A0A7S4ADR4_9STRA
MNLATLGKGDEKKNHDSVDDSSSAEEQHEDKDDHNRIPTNVATLALPNSKDDEKDGDQSVSDGNFASDLEEDSIVDDRKDDRVGREQVQEEQLCPAAKKSTNTLQETTGVVVEGTNKADDSDAKTKDGNETDFDVPFADDESESESEKENSADTSSSGSNGKSVAIQNDSSKDAENEKEHERERDTSSDDREAPRKERASREEQELGRPPSPSVSATIDAPNAATSPQRRSARARKPRLPYSTERHESSVVASVSAVVGKKKNNNKNTASKAAKKPSSSSSRLPKKQEWVIATDALFVKTEDKSAVTVKQIFLSLEKQFHRKITKQLKTVVRDRLRALITGTAKPAFAKEKETTSNESDSDSNNGEIQSSSESESDDYSEEDADDEASDYSDSDDKNKATKQKKKALAAKQSKKKKKKKTVADEEADDNEDEDANEDAKTTRTRRRTVRPKRRKAAARAAAKVVEAHKLRRKKRADELKVRNEEMQLDQTREDEERMDAIAAKFETNTDELRLKRLEDRLDLLQRLDETRISVVVANETISTSPTRTPTTTNEDSIEKKNGLKDNAAADIANKEKKVEAPSDSSSSSEEESSSDEEDLVIVGMKKPFKPLEPLHNHLPSRGLQLLKEIGSPKGGGNKKSEQRSKAAADITLPIAATKKSIKKMDTDTTAGSAILSPNRSMRARFTLRNALKQKQRRQGNQWLARELGYKTEEDHLKDCRTLADQKRVVVVKLEQERLKANERKQLRERLILQEQQSYISTNDGENNQDDDPEDEEYVPPGEDEHTIDVGEEEDEELKLAKEIEQEAKERDVAAHQEGLEEDSNSNGNSNTSNTEAVETQSLDTQPRLSDESSTLICSENETNAPNPDFNKHRLSLESEAQEKESENSGKILLDTQPSLVDKLTDRPLLTKEVSKLLDQQKTGSSQPQSASNSNSETRSVDEIKESRSTTETGPVRTSEESVVTPDKKSSNSDDEEELEFDGNGDDEDEDRPTRSRNAGWQAMLKREAEKLKKQKKKKGGLVEEEAEEEEEEEIAGLEDFGFSITKKNKNNDDEDTPDDLNEDDLEHVVDDVSDGEGDEDAGMVARKQLERQEEKHRHKEILRRMREGYDGRRGGIAGGGGGARGMHRFDQLVAADNREDAKRLGLLNDDELDSEDEKEGAKSNGDDEDDETKLLDKMLKDRFMHRSDVDLEENFSEDEEEQEDQTENGENPDNSHDEEMRTQERLAKRFAKRARMQRLEEMHGDSQEFSQQRLIEEDVRMKEELSQMRCGLVRRSSSLSRRSSQSSESSSNLGPLSRKRQRSNEASSGSNATVGGGSLFRKTPGSLSIALRANKLKRRSSFLGGNKAVDGKETGGVYKTLSRGHVLFRSQTSKSGSGASNSQLGKRKQGQSTSGSLFSKVSGNN